MTERTDAQPKKKKKKTPWKRFWKTVRSPLRVQREGGWLPYFWHGMRFGTWIGLLRRGRFDITLNCVPNILTVTFWTPINSAVYHLAEALHGKRADAHEIDPPPIFVIGHWRSGTTFLHDMLTCDPEHGYPTTFQCFFPNNFLLTGGIHGRWFNIFLPRQRPMDNVPVSVERPQEDEFAFANMGIGTHYITLAWPRHGPRDMDYLDLVNLGEAERKSWERGFLRFLRRLSYRQGKRLVLKSPAHTARIATLVKLFPEARFVHICRNPLEMFPSTVNLWKTLNSVQGLHNPANDEPWLEEFVFTVLERVYARYDADKHLISEGNLVEIRYEDLAADPKGVLKDVYAKLELGDFARTEEAVDAYLAAVSGHERNVFEMPDGLRERIVKRWGAYIDRFGYRETVT